MAGTTRFPPSRRKAVTEGAIGAKACGRVDARLGIDVFGMRKPSQNAIKQWREYEQRGFARRTMTHGANGVLAGRFEFWRMTELAAIVIGTLQLDRTLDGRLMAQIAFQTAQSLSMETMHGKHLGLQWDKREQQQNQYFHVIPRRSMREFSRLGRNRKKSLSRL